MEGKIVVIEKKVICIILYSSVHDHANSHCFMKLLQGSLKETQYHWPDNNVKNTPLKQKFSTNHNTDEVTYINGKYLFSHPVKYLYKMHFPSIYCSPNCKQKIIMNKKLQNILLYTFKNYICAN